jgi:hypothetical protein
LAAEHADDEPGGYDIDFQTYTELLRAPHVAERRRQVLWVSSRCDPGPNYPLHLTPAACTLSGYHSRLSAGAGELGR